MLRIREARLVEGGSCSSCRLLLMLLTRTMLFQLLLLLPLVVGLLVRLLEVVVRTMYG